MKVSHKVNIKLVASDHLLCWIILFVSEDIPAKLNSSKKRSIEGLYVEIHLRKQKWLITCSCNLLQCLHMRNICKHAEEVSKSIDLLQIFSFNGRFQYRIE